MPANDIPVPASILEESDYTSVQRRITSPKSNGPDPEESQASDRVHRADDFLSPVSIDERKDPLGANRIRNDLFHLDPEILLRQPLCTVGNLLAFQNDMPCGRLLNRLVNEGVPIERIG